MKPFKLLIAAVALAALTCTACDKNTPTPNVDDDVVYSDFQLMFANGSGSQSGTLVQGVADISTGEITYVNKGFNLPSSRTARVFASTDGSTIYSLSYRAGTIHKHKYTGGSNYTLVKTIDASIPLKSKGVRFTKMSDSEASVHEMTAKPVYGGEGNTQYQKHDLRLAVGLLNLETMEFKEGYKTELAAKLPEALESAGYYVNRVDAPVVSGNKMYYGASLLKWNPTTNTGTASEDYAVTLVIDYPSLQNPHFITTTLAKGATNGYRTPTQYKNEAGEILQMVSNSETKEVSILKIVNGQYHPTYKYSLNGLLKKGTASNGFFYAGRGIAYIPYEDFSTPSKQIGVNPAGQPTYSHWWRLARMDLNNNTVVDLDVPDDLWLTQYQASSIRKGKFYIALSPEATGEGNIYIFDINSTGKKGTVGAAIKTEADQRYIGIY